MTAARPADHQLLAEFGAKVELGGSTGERRAGPILDAGRHGLEFFRLFGPPHARFTRTRHNFRLDFRDRYDREADLVFDSLRADQERFAGVDDGLADIAINLRNHGTAVFESWRGDAAVDARTRLSELIAAAGTTRERFGRLADLVGDVVDAADRAVYQKAAATGKLYADRVDGRTADDVRFLVDFHGRAQADDVDDDEIFRAASLCGAKTRASLWRSRSTLLTEVAAAVDRWLRGTFVPAYEAKVAAFQDICATAERKLAEGWRRLTDLLDTVDPAAAPPSTSRPAANAPVQSTAAAERPSVTAVSGGGGPVPAEHERARAPLAPGGAVTSAPGAAGDPEARRPTQTQSSTPAAGGGPLAPGMLGGMPMLGGGTGGEDLERRAPDLPLAGLAFGDAGQNGAAIGAEDDNTEYNDATADEAEAARRREERLPVADKADGDVW